MTDEHSNDAKRLAFLLPNMRGGGAERVALRLIQDFVAAGHHVDLLLMEKSGELLELVPAEVRVIDLNAKRIRSAFLPLVRYFRNVRPDAMQISMWPLTVIGIAAARLARAKARIVTSEHITLTRQYAHFRRLSARLQAASIRLFYPLADARIAVSKVAADDLARLSGIDRSSVDVVYNPVATPPEPAGPDPEIERLWGEDKVPRIITVGSLKEQKNHFLLIRAFALLVGTRPARLMILGEGELRDRLETLAEAEGVADRIVFPGFTLDPWPYYRSADLFALSSDYEGYPLVLIEAMRAGLDIVSTDCESGPREILDGGKYGKLVPCNDPQALARAMAEALANPADPGWVQARAEELSGQSTSDRYFELMTGDLLVAGVT